MTVTSMSEVDRYDSDEYCECMCKLYQVTAEQFSVVCVCDQFNTTDCPSFECHPEADEVDSELRRRRSMTNVVNGTHYSMDVPSAGEVTVTVAETDGNGRPASVEGRMADTKPYNDTTYGTRTLLCRTMPVSCVSYLQPKFTSQHLMCH